MNGGIASAVQPLAQELSTRSDVEAIEIVNLRRELTEYEAVPINGKLLVHYLPGQRRGVMATRAYWDYLRARRIASKFQPTVVHGQGLISGGHIATRLGYPSVVTIHGLPEAEASAREKGLVVGRVRVMLVKRAVVRALRQARLVISLSHYDQQVLGPGLRGAVVRIPNAVRHAFFASDPTPATNSRILFAGSILPLKNVCGIIRAFAKVNATLPEASLTLAGFAPDEAYFKQVMAEIRNQALHSVHYAGNLSTEELAAAMRRSGVVVLFSTQENMPCVIAEAMASSRAVVSSQVGGVPEMVKDGYNGCLVAPGDEDALSASLIRLLTDPELRRTMGERGHALARARWLPEAIADQTIKAYELALNPRVDDCDMHQPAAEDKAL
jgi:glycosyltransferase involved in cell wall biosynthesis